MIGRLWRSWRLRAQVRRARRYLRGQLMSERKKWRLRLLPTFTERSMESKAAAYRQVARYRAEVADGMSRLTSVVVLVDDRTGQGWQPYERIDLRDGSS